MFSIRSSPTVNHIGYPFLFFLDLFLLILNISLFFLNFPQVQQKGMRAETLDALGITTPMHRSLLQYFEPRTYSNDIEVGTYRLFGVA